MMRLDSNLHLQYYFSSARFFQIRTVPIIFDLQKFSYLNRGTIIKIELEKEENLYFPQHCYIGEERECLIIEVTLCLG